MEHIQYKFSELANDKVFTRKGSKVSLSRWFQLYFCIDDLLQTWTTRLVVYIYIGLRLGWMRTGVDYSKVLGKSTKLLVDADKEAGSTRIKSGKSAVSKAMNQCQNSLHAATILMLDYSSTTRLRVMREVMRPVALWYTNANKEVRSLEACHEFYVDESNDQGLRVVQEMCAIFSNVEALERMTLQTTVSTPFLELLGDDKEHPLVQEANAVAKQAVQLTIKLISYRCKRMAWLFWGIPGMLARKTLRRESKSFDTHMFRPGLLFCFRMKGPGVGLGYP